MSVSCRRLTRSNGRAKRPFASSGASRERGVPARHQSSLPRRYAKVIRAATNYALRQRGIKVGTCVPVLCEIEAGIQQVSQPDAYRLNLERLLRQIRVWPVDPSTAMIYGAIHHDLRGRGRVLSQVDMMVAALARQMVLTVATSDQDFAALPDIATEDWTGVSP